MSARRATPGSDAPSVRSWRARLDDPDEPLYTVAVAADLLGVDTQALRRLGEALDHDGRRPSGNQRRYSRHDLDLLSQALDLRNDGHAAASILVILDLERRVHDADGPPRR